MNIEEYRGPTIVRVWTNANTSKYALKNILYSTEECHTGLNCVFIYIWVNIPFN